MASAYVLHLLNSFFILIYERSIKGQNKEKYKEGSADNQVLEGVKIDRTYQINNKVRVDISVTSDLTSKLKSRLKSSGD